MVTMGYECRLGGVPGCCDGKIDDNGVRRLPSEDRLQGLISGCRGSEMQGEAWKCHASGWKGVGEREGVDVVRVVGVEVPRKRKMVRIWTIGHKD
jgi:hypothetical protein